MTEHPLTDKMIQAISHNIHAYDDTRPFRADMRAAADWQLGQVAKSVERRIKVLRQSGYVFAADAIEDFFQGLMQNMRPQEDN
jgi:hypothetical protein